MSLLSNAIKYGREPFSIRARAANHFLTIRMIDNGDEVPEEFTPKLFERFSQAHQVKEVENNGTGLGPPIVYGIAASYGGTAWYEPNKPQGPCFGVKRPKAP